MGSKRRSNTFTRFLEDMVDDTKSFVDDLIDRSKDVETNTGDAITDVVDDEADDDERKEMEAMRATLVDLRTKIDEMSKSSSGGASKS